MKYVPGSDLSHEQIAQTTTHARYRIVPRIDYDLYAFLVKPNGDLPVVPKHSAIIPMAEMDAWNDRLSSLAARAKARASSRKSARG